MTLAAVLLNAAITVLVLMSPIGIGDGSGGVGYSVFRLLILLLAQTPLSLLSMVGSFYCLGQRSPWLSVFLLNLLIMAATLFAYFYQRPALQRLFE